MVAIHDRFEFTYDGCEIRYGRGRTAELWALLDRHELDRALVVCGSNVGANDDLMEPIREGLGTKLAGVFDETTPEKRVETAAVAVDRMREVDADVLVGVGGGSSLDVARQSSVLAADGRSASELEAAAREGDLDRLDPSEQPIPVVVIPTTFAGADVSTGGSLVVLSAEESPTGQPVTVSGSVTPIANVADPAAFETTPRSALDGSAMNGFDKGIETLYAREANPFSDATAIRGLRYLREALPSLSDGNPEAYDRAVLGMLLVQYERKASIVHAFGHAFARRYPVQQGHVHAVMAPHVVRYVLENTDGYDRKLADGLAVDADGDREARIDAIVEAITAVRDSLDVPQRAGELPEADSADVPAIAEFTMNDWMMPQAPPELDPTLGELEAILEAAW